MLLEINRIKKKKTCKVKKNNKYNIKKKKKKKKNMDFKFKKKQQYSQVSRFKI